MEDLFVKKYWTEEDILFYIHFRNGAAWRQVEINSSEKVFLSVENPVQGDSMLYDQSLEDLDVDATDFIAEAEFESIWNKFS